MKVFIILTVFTSFAYAAITSGTIESPRSVALGSAIHGNIGLNSVLHDNPAGIAFSKKYTVAGGYANLTKDAASYYEVSVVDSRTSKAAGGFSYAKLTTSDKTSNYDLFNLVLAERYWKNTSVYIGGRYVKSKINETKSSFYDFDIGFLTAFNEFLSLGLTWKNLKQSDEEFAPEELALGAQLGWKWFYPTGTITKKLKHGFSDTDKLSYSAGLEIAVDRKYYARGGYNIDDETKKSNYAVGLAWKAPKISFNYAFERSVDNKDEYRHLFSTRVDM
jgi:hypothetical protein